MLGIGDIKGLLELFAGNGQDEERAQQQLQPVLERRFDPCVALWQDLWQFLSAAEKQRPTKHEVDSLLQQVESFLQKHGALVSIPCLGALMHFRATLQQFDTTDAKLVEIRDQIVTTDKMKKKSPGLLMILRDEVGSNSKAASSRLK